MGQRFPSVSLNWCLFCLLKSRDSKKLFVGRLVLIQAHQTTLRKLLVCSWCWDRSLRRSTSSLGSNYPNTSARRHLCSALQCKLRLVVLAREYLRLWNRLLGLRPEIQSLSTLLIYDLRFLDRALKCSKAVWAIFRDYHFPCRIFQCWWTSAFRFETCVQKSNSWQVIQFRIILYLSQDRSLDCKLLMKLFPPDPESNSSCEKLFLLVFLGTLTPACLQATWRCRCPYHQSDSASFSSSWARHLAQSQWRDNLQSWEGLPENCLSFSASSDISFDVF